MFVLIVGGLAGALWKHVVEDAKVRERLATLEADAETTKEEVKSLRERWHDLRDDTLKRIWELFEDKFERFREEVRRLIDRDKK